MKCLVFGKVDSDKRHYYEHINKTLVYVKYKLKIYGQDMYKYIIEARVDREFRILRRLVK